MSYKSLTLSLWCETTISRLSCSQSKVFWNIRQFRNFNSCRILVLLLNCVIFCCLGEETNNQSNCYFRWHTNFWHCPKFTFSIFTPDPNLHKSQIYTGPIFTQPRFTQTHVRTYILRNPNLHKTQIYTTQIYTKPKFTQPKFTQPKFTQNPNL